MIFTVIFFSILIINSLFIFILKSKINKFNVPSWLLNISIVVLIAGVILVLWQQSSIKNELAKRDWKIAEGKIIKSEIVGDRAIRSEVEYRYQVKDTFYSGISDYNIPGFGGKNYRRKNARIVKKENPVGRKIMVFYNPSKPEISTLRYGPYWSNYMIIGFGGFLLFIGMFVTELVLLKKIIKI
jgi:hypothetical protein